MKKRYVIPVDFTEPDYTSLRKDAAARGLPTAPYIRMLLVTHPDRKPHKKTKLKGIK